MQAAERGQVVASRRQSITELSLQQYNAMLVGTYQLLETRAGAPRLAQVSPRSTSSAP